MKNNSLYTLLTVLSVFSFAGCDNDKTDNGISVQAPAVLMGKAYTFDPVDAGEQWKSGKTVGVYMLQENSANCVEPYCNVKYETTVQPVGYFTPSNQEDVLYYPQNGSKVDIVAYYPWKEDLTDNLYPINVSNQKSTANFNFYYAGNGRGLNKDNRKTTLELRPVLAQIVCKLVAGDGVKDENLTGSSIKISGMPTKADFNMLSGRFHTATEVKDIALVALSEGNGASGQVFPTNSMTGCETKITLPNMNRIYSFDLASEISTLEAGVKYICNVKVSLDKIEVVTEQSPIDDWEDGNSIVGKGEEFIPDLINTPIADLPSGSLPSVADPMKEADGKWCFFANGVTLSAVVEPDASLQRNVLHTNFVSGVGSWFKQYVAYRMQNAEASVYTLRFKAKGTKGKNIRCFIKTDDLTTGADPGKTTTNVFMANNLLGGAKPYAGYVDFTLSDTYKEVALEFNFAKMLKDPYTYTEADVRIGTDKALANFFIAFFSPANGVECYLDDISLKKKK